MLVVSRFPDQKIIVRTSDGEIQIMLVACDKHKAKIGVLAPESVTINREEVQQAIDATATDGPTKGDDHAPIRTVEPGSGDDRGAVDRNGYHQQRPQGSDWRRRGP